MSFTAVYYTTISRFQHVSAECATVLQENKTEIRTEFGPTKTLFVCVCVFLFCFVFFNYFRLYFLGNELLSALFVFLLMCYFVFRVRLMRSTRCYDKAVRKLEAKILENVITFE